MIELHPFKSLLHFVEQDQTDQLSIANIAVYEDEWNSQVIREGSLMNKYYSNEERLHLAISSLRSNLKEQKALFKNKNILAFLEDWKWEEDVISDWNNLSENHNNSWLETVISDGIVQNYFYRFLDKGLSHVEEVKKMRNLYYQLSDSAKSEIQRKFENSFNKYEGKVKEVLNSLSSESALPKELSETFTTLQKLVLEELPFDNKNFLLRYGRLLDDVVKKYSGLISRGQLPAEEMEKLSSIANLGAKILEKEDLKKVARVIHAKAGQQASSKNASNVMAKIVGAVIVVLILGIGGKYLYQFFQDETSTKEEQYVAYLEKYREFSENRRISQELIEQRKNVEITDSYQYGERDNVPLFYTYLKTNKYLSINEINDEVYRLRKFINVEGIDTDKIFVQVHFFIHDQEDPYRMVMAEFPVRDRYADVKQIAKNRATAPFKSEGRRTEPYKLVVELKESFSSGIIEVSLLELLFDPTQDLVEIYTYDPMPSLAHTLSFSQFLELSPDPGNMDELYMAVAAHNIFHIPSAKTFRYRLPIDIENKSIITGLPALTGMINWELTTYDDLAFVRIRADDITGYYLMDRNEGIPTQSYASFPEENKVSREFFVQYVSLE